MVNRITRLFRRRFGRDKEFYALIYELLGIVPDNIELYKLALIHKSASVALPDGSQANNERLEFLGDAIIEAIVSDYLFIEYPEQAEGFLTQMRSRIVSRTSMEDIARKIGLDKHIVAKFNGTYTHKHLSGNALEAMIGAIYLDKGYDFTNRFLINVVFGQHLDLSDMFHTETDFKSRLIEWCQKSRRTIYFNTMHDKDSTSHTPKFVSTITIDGIELGHGAGASKKEAEQKAAYSVSQLLNDDEIGDYFLETIDNTFEKYKAKDDKVN